MFNLFNHQLESQTASGVTLQICDVFIQELNQVDSFIRLELIAELLYPFLKAIASIENKELKERIMDKIFKPLLENNKTVQQESEDEEEM